MIPLENLVINIEQAKHLKELGVAQSSRYYWVNCYSGEPINKWKLVPAIERDTACAYTSNYAAFSISEMVFILEKDITLNFCDISHGWSGRNLSKDKGKYGFYCLGGYGCGKEEECSGLTFRDYCYKQICCYIENISSKKDINDIINDA